MDHRKVPLEVLRDFALTHVELSSIRAVADDSGVSRSTLHKFITSGTTPHPRVRRLLGLWYLRRLEGIDEVELLRPYIGALQVLLSDAPEESQTWVATELLDSIDRGYCVVGEEPPPWSRALRTRLVRIVDDQRRGAPARAALLSF